MNPTIHRIAACAALIVLAAPAQTKPIGTSLPLANPGFEDGLSEWISADDRGMSAVIDEARHGGRRGLRVSDADTSAGSSLSTARFRVNPGYFYQVGFWAKAVSGTGIGVYLQFYNAQGRSFGDSKANEAKYKLAPFVLPSGEESWTEYALRCEAPEGAVEGQVWIHSFNGAQVVADFDDFSLAMLTPAEAKAQPLAEQENLPWPGKVELPSFKKIDPGSAFAALKIYDEKKSPVRAPREDWARAARLVKDDTNWAKWLADRRTALETWMENCRENAAWKTGWWHNFVSPKDGSFLTFKAEVPGDTLTSPSDPAVPVTPKIFEAWVFGFRSRHAGRILEAARLYRLTGERRYGEWAAAQLDFYAENLMNWPLQNKMGTSRIMGQGLDEAVNLIQYVGAARLLENFARPARRAQWTEGLFLPEARLLNDSFQVIHNIACWQRSAAAVVALHAGDEELWKLVIDGPNGVRAQIDKGITGDYLWYEQSMGYNSFVVMALAPLFREALRVGRGDALREEARSVENLMLAPISMRFPNGQIPNPADTTLSRPEKAPNLGFLADMADLFPTTLGSRRRAELRSWSTLLDPPENLGEAPPLPPVESRSLESSRMAILAGGPWQVFFHYGQLAASHAEAEALHYELAFEKLDLSHDPGTVGYGSPLHSGYYTLGLCHNVPLVDGQGQLGWHPGVLERFETNEVRASQPKYRRNAEASRTLRLEGGKFIDLTTLKTLDDKTHALGLTLHVQGKLRLPPGFAPAADFAASHKANGFQYWRDFQGARFTDKASVELDVEGKTFRIDFELPGEFLVIHASAPDFPPTRRAALYLETQGKTLAVKTTWSVK